LLVDDQKTNLGRSSAFLPQSAKLLLADSAAQRTPHSNEKRHQAVDLPVHEFSRSNITAEKQQ
jgi:hypothetical protein